MEVNTQKRLSGLQEKVPDIQKTLDMVRFLRKRKVRCALALPIASWESPVLSW